MNLKQGDYYKGEFVVLFGTSRTGVSGEVFIP